MLEPLISRSVNDWLAQVDCPAQPYLRYMRSRGQLREVQVQALQTYLFLLLEGRNQSLSTLWAQGLFTKQKNFIDPASRMPQNAQQRFTHDAAARTWHQLLSGQSKDITQWLEDNANEVDYDQLTRDLFYGWQNTDYVFSLPMGSGKTWLMAAMMYLNLYLGDLHPGDTRFARNFAVLIPSAKKSSILPSLRSIERFDPASVIPEPAASALRQRLKFEVLDAAKTAAKSNQIRNPNARKVAQHLADPNVNGLVLVVNAEKVILDRIDDRQAQLIEQSDDERDKAANELRNIIGRTPGLMLLVDEVHGAAHDEIRLRQVIQRWHAAGHVHSVLGFSGTPFLDKAQSLHLGPHVLKQTQISTVVHHYPLTEAVRTFLKIPEVKTAHGLDAAQIVSLGTQEFFQNYGGLTYPDGCTSKLAIYCGSIERLENEVFPLVQQFAPGQILKYHRGNKDHPAPKGAEADFAALDSPANPYRVVLLVQIGKEGWDCKSLTGVILAQKGDSPSNMVLQSSCRCLREVERGTRHKALIYLSADNAKILEDQLKSTQGTTIAQLNAAGSVASPMRPVHSRMAWLESRQQLPLIEAWQLRLKSQTLQTEATSNTAAQLGKAIQVAHTRADAHLSTGNFDSLQVRSTDLSTLGETAEFADWLRTVCSESAGSVQLEQLLAHLSALQEIFDALTEPDPRTHQWPDAQVQLRRYQTLAPQAQVRSLVRQAFWPLRRYTSEVEALPESAQLLLLQAGALPAHTPDHPKLYPSALDTQSIVQADAQHHRGTDLAANAEQEMQQARAALQAAGLAEMASALPSRAPAPAVQAKEQSFHYLPYDFAQSGLELGLLVELLKFEAFRASGLEIYYNGARHLTEFRIECFAQSAAQRWQRIGTYTPDFLLLSRYQNAAQRGQVHKVLIIEAKGAGFAEQSAYTQRRDFVKNDFLRINNDKFNYLRFDFVQIDEPANKDYVSSAQALRRHASQFFGLAC